MAEKKKEPFHERPLRWIATPLEEDEESFSSTSTLLDRFTESRRIPKRPFAVHNQPRPDGGLGPSHRTDAVVALRTREASAPNELFYDLFFAAAFGTFTESHNIDDAEALTGYIGFFSLLWITWMNVSLFDVRLARDSIFDRVAKAIQFLVMAGFALVGTIYNVSAFSDADSIKFFQTEAQPLSLILMVSRWTLSIQYLSAVWYTRNHRSVWLPSLLIAISYAVTACVYLGISFVLPVHNKTGYDSYIAWFVLAAGEILINLTVSIYWPKMNFMKTHLVDRMSALTLIVLGESVIMLFQSVMTAFQAGATLKFLIPPALGATLMIYFMYMAYFDNLPDPEERFGNVSEPIWAALHFPLTVAIVIAAVGSRFILSFSLATQSLTLPNSAINDQLLLNLTYFSGSFCYNWTNVTVSGVDFQTQGYVLYDDYLNYTYTYDGEAEYDLYGYGDVNTNDPISKPDPACAKKVLLETTHAINEWYGSFNTSISDLVDATQDASLAKEIDGWKQQILDANKSMIDLHLGSTAALQISRNIVPLIMSAYQLDPPQAKHTSVSQNSTGTNSTHQNSTQTSQDVLLEFDEALAGLYDFVYCYFMISSGLFLIILGSMVLLSNRMSRYAPDRQPATPSTNDTAKEAGEGAYTWVVWDYIRRLAIFLAGIVLCLLAIRVKQFIQTESDDLDTEGDSGLWILQDLTRTMNWTIPTVTLVYFGVILVDHIPFEAMSQLCRRLTGGRKNAKWTVRS